MILGIEKDFFVKIQQENISRTCFNHDTMQVLKTRCQESRDPRTTVSCSPALTPRSSMRQVKLQVGTRSQERELEILSSIKINLLYSGAFVSKIASRTELSLDITYTNMEVFLFGSICGLFQLVIRTTYK